MAIKLGNGDVNKLYLGSTEIIKAYFGATEVYSAGGGPVTNDAFEFTIQTSTASQSFTLALEQVSSVDIDWGDGTVDTGVTTDLPSHTYATADTYSVSVTGTAPVLNYGGSNQAVLDSRVPWRTVTNMGDLGWTSVNFSRCEFLTSFVAGDFNTSQITSMNSFFYVCARLQIIDFSGNDISTVTDLNSFNRFKFNTSTSNFDVTPFANSPIQTISNFIEYSTVTGMQTWDASNITNGTNCLNSSTMSTADYDATLIAWAAQSLQSGVTFHFGNSKYTAGGAAEAARTTLVSTYGLTITDGGAA